MDKMNILIIVVIAAIALIVFLVWKNQKDRVKLNPDAPDAMEETRMDQERRKDKV